MESNQLFFYAYSMVISAFVGAMASSVWEETIIKSNNPFKFVILLIYFLGFMLATLLAIYMLAKKLGV